MALEDKVRDIIVEQLGVNADQVTPEASFIEDLGADSLDTVELVMAFEEEFGIEIPDEDAEKIGRVKEAIDYIESRLPDYDNLLFHNQVFVQRARGIGAIDLRVIGSIFVSWLITLPAGAVLAIIFFYTLRGIFG